MAPSIQNSKTAKAKARQNCIHCKKRYTPFRATSKYCSDSCRVLACNQRKTEAEDKADKYEDSMQRSLRWHRKQDHLQKLSEGELRAHIEAKWEAREQRNLNTRIAAKERYAERKSSEGIEVMRQRMQAEVERQKRQFEEHNNANQKQDPVARTASNNPKIETKRKRVIVPKQRDCK